jgi:predicted molibdopterin-dependent oxidoreductase YjgC
MELALWMGSPVNFYQDESEIFNEIAAVTPIMAGISYERIDQEGIQWPCPTNDHPGTSTFFLNRFNTPSGRVILNPVDYVPQNEKATAEYPFLLNTGRILYHYQYDVQAQKGAYGFCQSILCADAPG